MASASHQSPDIYWACFGMTISNVGSKFAKKKIVKSRPFRSEQDPYNCYFEMRLSFGSENRDSWLQAHVRNTTSDVTYQRLKYTLRDNIDNVLQTVQHVDTNTISEKGNDFGWTDFYDAEILANPETIVWRVICEVQYEPYVKPVDPPPRPIGRFQCSLIYDIAMSQWNCRQS